MKCVVTGGAGFIASHIVDLLVEEGMDVVSLDNFSTGSERNLNSGARSEHLDICDAEAVKAEVADADYVFHAAALPRIQPSYEEPVVHEETNVIGTINVVSACIGTQVKKLVVSGSSAIYGNPERLPTPETEPARPLSPYALQKFAAEQYALMLGDRFGVPVVVLRYFNAYGPRSFNPRNPQNAYSSVVGIFNNQKKAGEPLEVTGDGQQSRDFVHVNDIAKANFMAAESGSIGDVFNVGTGRHTSIIELARMFDHPVEMIAERKGEAKIAWSDISKIQSHLGWNPTIELSAGIEML